MIHKRFRNKASETRAQLPSCKTTIQKQRFRNYHSGQPEKNKLTPTKETQQPSVVGVGSGRGWGGDDVLSASELSDSLNCTKARKKDRVACTNMQERLIPIENLGLASESGSGFQIILSKPDHYRRACLKIERPIS